MNQKLPLPPFTHETATEKVRLAENAWNTKSPENVSLAYTQDTQWRNRSQFIQGREAIQAFLTQKWQRETQYKLVKELWAFNQARIAVRFAYEYQSEQGQWYRAYGNENWAFDNNGLMHTRIASINEHSITRNERQLTWSGQQRPEDFAGLTELGL